MADEGTTKVETAPKTETSSVVDVLHYDPFKAGDKIPEAKAGAKATDNSTADTGTGDEKTGTDEGTPSPTPAPTVVPKKDAVGTDSQADYWKQIADHQRTLIEGKGGKEEPKEEGVKIPAYNFNIPDKLVEALTSTEVPVFKQGVIALIQGMAGAVHAQMINHVSEMFEPKFRSIPEQIMQTLQAQAQNNAVADDFYGKYKELNHPQLHGIVLQTATAIAKEKNLTGWSEELRDETAKRVKDIIAVATGGAGAAKPKAPATLPNGSGARTVKKTGTETDDIASTLGF